jgi:hypothetical protein
MIFSLKDGIQESDTVRFVRLLPRFTSSKYGLEIERLKMEAACVPETLLRVY